MKNYVPRTTHHRNESDTRMYLQIREKRRRVPLAAPHGGLRDLEGQFVGEVKRRQQHGLVPRVAEREGHVGEGLFGVGFGFG